MAMERLPMRDSTLVKLWSEVSRSFLPRAATAREIETAQNAFLAGALGVFLQLEQAIESEDQGRVALVLKRLRRELNLGMRRRGRAPR
jgi:hypothetical protein